LLVAGCLLSMASYRFSVAGIPLTGNRQPVSGDHASFYCSIPAVCLRESFFALLQRFLCVTKYLKQKILKTFETMKRNTQKLMLIVMCALSFAACKKDQLTPEEPMNAKSNGNASLIQPAPTYTLTRRGTDSLEYYNDGRLAKVIHNFGYTQYNYGGFGAIIAKTYGNGNLLEHQDIYQIDAATGRTYEQESKGFTNAPSGAIVTTNVYKFVYDGQGRLTKKYNKDKPNERLEFFYNADGNLIEIKRYSSTNEFWLKHVYGYDATAPANKLKLNPEKQGFDMFLPIFGSFCKKMPTVKAGINPLGSLATMSESYIYSVNNDGHVTKFDRLDNMKNKMLAETVVFNYKPIRKF
jgi:YD repeat-containing protein